MEIKIKIKINGKPKFMEHETSFLVYVKRIATGKWYSSVLLLMYRQIEKFVQGRIYNEHTPWNRPLVAVGGNQEHEKVPFGFKQFTES